MNRTLAQLLFVSLALIASPPLPGQGNVNFANAGVGLNSPFLHPDGTTRLGVGTFTVELLAGPDANALALAAPAYMGRFANGYFNAGARFLGNVTGNTAIAMVHVWDNVGGTITSFEQAVATPGAIYGSTAPFAVALTLPPATPASLVGMTGQEAGLILVPEPSPFALLLLGGLAALWVLRHTHNSPSHFRGRNQ